MWMRRKPTKIANNHLAEVLKFIKPSKDELAREQGFAKSLVRHVQKFAPSCEVVLTGSMAKGTFIRDKKDVDVFVLFDRSVKREQLEPAIKGIMKVAFPSIGYQLSYAEHPYIRFHCEGRRVDLVPAYKISNASERLSAVDRSVLHTSFVNRSLKAKQIDSVLLLKQFLKANSIYGAEIKIAGFSGYLCELLIIKYGDFTKLVKAAAKWNVNKPLFIDLRRYYKSKHAISTAIQKFGNFTVIDPTDSNRNVAAAVSVDTLKRFVTLSKAYLKKPGVQAFMKKPEQFDDVLQKLASKNPGRVLVISVPRPNVVDDVLWGQLHKLTGQLERELDEFGVKKVVADDHRHLVRIAVVLAKNKLPERMLLEGPPVAMKEHVVKFKKSHNRAKFVVKKKHIWADVKRAAVRPEAVVMEFFRNYSKTKSHLAYPEEMIVVRMMERGKKK